MKAAGFDEYEFISLGEEADNVCRVCDDLDGQRFKIADWYKDITVDIMVVNKGDFVVYRYKK